MLKGLYAALFTGWTSERVLETARRYTVSLLVISAVFLLYHLKMSWDHFEWVPLNVQTVDAAGKVTETHHVVIMGWRKD